ncbi:MAG: hypothetical protein K8S23_14050 [Candidatus Cloacimonetes bacterium]|nr:hypothetical protein [Candidatus Cloacimonadota bacterium]
MKRKKSKVKESIKCPFCNNQRVHRIHRNLHLRSIPFSELYECSACRGEFLTVFGFVKFKIDTGYSGLINLMNRA